MSTFAIEGDYDLVKMTGGTSFRLHDAQSAMTWEWAFVIPALGTWAFELRLVVEAKEDPWPTTGTMKVRIRGGDNMAPVWTEVVNRGLTLSGDDSTPRPWALSVSLDDTTGDIDYAITDPDGVNYTGTVASTCPGGLTVLAQTQMFATGQIVNIGSTIGTSAAKVRHRVNYVLFSEDGVPVISEDFPDTTFDPPWDAQTDQDNPPWGTWGVSDADYLHMNTDSLVNYGSLFCAPALTLLNIIPAAFSRDSLAMKLVSPTEVVCVRSPRTTPGSEATQIEYTRLWRDGARDVTFPSQDYPAQSAGGISLATLGPELFGSQVMNSVDGVQTGVGVRVDRATPTAWTFAAAASALAIPGECLWAEIVTLPANAGFLMLMLVDVGGSLDLYHAVATDYYAGSPLFIVPVATGPTGADLPSASVRMLPTGEWLIGFCIGGNGVVAKMGWVQNDGTCAGVAGAVAAAADAQHIEIEQTLDLLVAMVLLESGGVYTWNQACGTWEDETTLTWSSVEVATGIDPSANVRGSLVSLPDGALLFAMIDDANATRFWRCEWMPADATGTWTEVVEP